MDFKLGRLGALTLVMLIWAGLYLPGLGVREISFNEGRRIFPGLTMLESGDWITSKLDGKEYYKKPPLINWMIASSVKISGEKSEFAVRLPSALAVLAFVLLLTAMPSTFLSLEARTLASIIYMTTAGALGEGRLAEIDGPFTCFVGIAIITWLNLWAGNASRWLLWPLSGVLLAFCLMLKGPIALLFFYCTVFCVLGFSRRWKELLHPAHWVGLILAFGIVALWLVPALAKIQQGAAGSAAAGTGKDMLLFFMPQDFRVFKWLERVLRSPFGFMPWLILVPLFWLRGWRDSINPEHKNLFRACLWGVLIPFVIISLMPGTKGRYSMPVYPLLCVLLAWVLCREKDLPALVQRICRCLLQIALAVLMVGGIFASVLTENPVHFLVPMLAFVILFFAWLHRFDLKRASSFANIAGLGALAGMISYVIFVMPLTLKNERCFVLGSKINEVSAPAKEIFVFKLGSEAFMFYLKPGVRFVGSAEELPKESCTILLVQNEKSQEFLRKLDYEKRPQQRLACFKDGDTFYEVYKIGSRQDQMTWPKNKAFFMADSMR